MAADMKYMPGDASNRNGVSVFVEIVHCFIVTPRVFVMLIVTVSFEVEERLMVNVL